MRPFRQSGLTLIELLVVLLIVALGWFTLLPRLDPTDPGSFRESPLAKVNQLLAQAGGAAFSQGRFQELRVETHTGRLTWGQEHVRLPAPIAECRINGEPCLTAEAVFRVYAHGCMDRLVLAFFSGERWSSADLAARMVLVDL